MKKTRTDKLLRVPIKYVDGRWECGYGGIVPVEQDTVAELIVNDKAITDKDFLRRMRAPSHIKVLDEHVTLLAYLATKDQKGITEAQRKYLIPWHVRSREIATDYIDNWSTGGLSFVEVHIGQPTDQQTKKFDTSNGGLWLLTEGPKAVGLQSTQICLPDAVSKDPVISLNHAFTKLSETYEPWRLSHTGNPAVTCRG